MELCDIYSDDCSPLDLQAIINFQLFIWFCDCSNGNDSLCQQLSSSMNNSRSVLLPVINGSNLSDFRRRKNQVKGRHQSQCDLAPGLPSQRWIQTGGAGSKGQTNQNFDSRAEWKQIHFWRPYVSILTRTLKYFMVGDNGQWTAFHAKG